MSKKIEKTKQTSSLAKLTKPKPANVLMRKRLFKLLDDARKRPVIWITAPPGAGKTTLISTYLEQRKLPCIWYQVDEGDGDIASFFHYMSIAAKKAASHKKKPLPHLTPEYLAGLPAFTRNFFRELYSRLNPSVSPLTKGGIKRGVSKGGFAIVLDNYQEAPVNSPLHEIIQAGLSEIPEGINVIIISRTEPPSAFAGLRANNRMNILGWDELELSSEETSGIVQLKVQKKLSTEIIQELHDKTNGWAAGLVLMLERIRIEDIAKVSAHGLKSQAMFDYFAGEIFQKLDGASQEILLKTAFLPIMTGRLAEQLTGSHQAGGLLSELNRRNYFTIRKPLPEPVYQYHPLFREFLLAQARQQLTDEQLIQTQRRAAEILEGAGQFEDAIVLYRLSGDWASMARVILANAQTMIEQGRTQTLAEWLQSIPPPLREGEAWIFYWFGICRLPFSPSNAREQLETAYNLFKTAGDQIGQMLAWCAVVETFTYEMANFAPLDYWISELEKFLENNPVFPSPEIEASVAAGMFTALIFRQPQHPMLPAWTQRVEHIVASCPDMSTRFLVGLNLLLYYSWWTAEFGKGRHLIEMLKPLVCKEELPPLPRIAWHATEAVYYWIVAENTVALRAVEEGLKFAETSGVHLWDFMLLAQGVWARVTANDLAGAEAALDKLRSILNPQRFLDVIQYHLLVFCIAQQRSDISLMKEHAAAAHRASQQAKMPWAECQVLAVLALAHLTQGNEAELNKILHDFRCSVDNLASHSLGLDLLIVEAYYALQYQSRPDYLQALERMFTFARRCNLLNGNLWANKPLLNFCIDALEHNIEVAYVQPLIRKRNLLPEEPPLHLDNWPWAVKIHTLGRFNVVRDSKPLSLTAPSSRKPLELLSALIAFGGRGISKEMLIEALWPDAEGDVAQQSFETTLHRLRKLLGSDDILALKDGRLTLDDRCCWVDCWAFERLITQLEHLLGTADAKPDKVAEEIAGEIARKIDSIAKKIFNLYHGHFLGRESDHSWSLTLRERLRSRFLRHIKDMGRYWKGHKKIDEAVEYYIKGLEIDPISEGLYYGLMQCYIELGDFAEALSIYKRCCHALKTLLNTTPSPKIEGIYHSIKRDKTPQQEDRSSQ